MRQIKHIIIGTRGSKLAMLQSESVLADLQGRHPNLEFAIEKITTKGDRYSKASLSQIGGKGVFVRELEKALLNGRIDLAVHSLKDMPTEPSSDFSLAAVGKRVDARDVLISRSGRRLTELPSGARLGTGSPRRTVQLRAYRPDLEVCPLRGNLDTRLRKVFSGELDGVIVAAAGLIRMGWQDRIADYLPVEHFVPAVGQGALAIETRKDNEEMINLVKKLDTRHI